MAGGLLDLPDVHPGAEAAALGGDDHGAHGGVFTRRRDGLGQVGPALHRLHAKVIELNLIAPLHVAQAAAAAHYRDSGGPAAVAATVPLGRLVTPGDVAGACLFLASPLAASISARPCCCTAAASGPRTWAAAPSGGAGPGVRSQRLERVLLKLAMGISGGRHRAADVRP